MIYLRNLVRSFCVTVLKMSFPVSTEKFPLIQRKIGTGDGRSGGGAECAAAEGSGAAGCIDGVRDSASGSAKRQARRRARRRGRCRALRRCSGSEDNDGLRGAGSGDGAGGGRAVRRVGCATEGGLMGCATDGGGAGLRRREEWRRVVGGGRAEETGGRNAARERGRNDT
jgi:hypothetical protein